VHSACHQINVTLQANALKSELSAEISDDGKGFNYDQHYCSAEKHFGLRNMKQRAQEVHGEVKIVSKKQEGTAVFLTFPFQQPEK